MTQTRTPYTTQNKWDAIRRRLETAAKSVRGGCVVTISVIAVNGDPLSWMRPEVLPFEPRCDADKLMRFFAFGSAGIIEIDDSGSPAQVNNNCNLDNNPPPVV